MVVFDGRLTVLVQNDPVQVQTADGGDGNGIVDQVCQLFAQFCIQIGAVRSLATGAPVHDFSDLAHLFHQFHKQTLFISPVTVLAVQIGFQRGNSDVHWIPP